MTNIPRLLIVILGLSLSANLLTAGFLIGRVISKPHHQSFQSMRINSLYYQIVRALPPEQRSDLKKSLREQRRPIEVMSQDRKKQIDKIEQVLIAENFVPSLLRKVLDDNHVRLVKQHQLMVERIIKEISSLDYEQRSRFINKLKDRRFRNE